MSDSMSANDAPLMATVSAGWLSSYENTVAMTWDSKVQPSLKSGLIDRSRKILEGPVSEIKESFRSNTFELSYVPGTRRLRDLLGKDFEIMSDTLDEKLATARVSIRDPREKEAMLQKAIAGIDLIGFHEVFPSINDIFIARVRENENTKKESHE